MLDVNGIAMGNLFVVEDALKKPIFLTFSAMLRGKLIGLVSW